MDEFVPKNNYTITDLRAIMKRLRAPGGCPWDAQQTHKSIQKNLIEECYEVIEAINKNDTELLCEELGDVLMQVVFHAQMEEEAGTFTLDEVTDGICKKLIERHPHVFADTAVDGVADVLRNWDQIKRSKKGQKAGSAPMQSIPRELPALMRSTKIQQKAAAVGFDWPDVNGAIQKLQEELLELQLAIQEQSSAEVFEELGDVLFSVVNVSRFLQCDAEEALTAASDKFIRRFIGVEQLAQEQGLSLEGASLQELDTLWDKVKEKQ